MLRGNRVSQQPGKVQNQLVANGVAEAVVDAFQVVHVKDDTGGRRDCEKKSVNKILL